MTLRRALQAELRRRFARLKGRAVRRILDDVTLNAADQPRDPDGRFSSGSWAEAAKAIPGKLLAAARDRVASKYAKLTERYGSRYAKAIVGAALVGLPLPLPGASLLTAAPMVALAELHRFVSNEAYPDWVHEEAEKLLAELRVVFNYDRVDEFRRWVAEQVDSELDDPDLWRKYSELGFQRGASRAFDDARRRRPGQTVEMHVGAKDEFMRTALGAPVHEERIKVLAQRAYGDMDGVTDAMETRMVRSLADGLVEGAPSSEIAKDIAEDCDWGMDRAMTVARTEIVRAHADGQLDMLDRLGVDEVGIEVEWVTVDSDLTPKEGGPCKECAAMEGTVLPIADARGVIPLHPN